MIRLMFLYGVEQSQKNGPLCATARVFRAEHLGEHHYPELDNSLVPILKMFEEIANATWRRSEPGVRVPSP